jgi:hypothetical protein
MASNKYAKYDSANKIEERPWQIHPIWRGLGCIMLILIPIISFLGAYILISEGIVYDLGIPYPEQFANVLFSFDFLETTYAIDMMTLIITGVLIIIGFAALMILYSIMYSVLGPPRYGPLDARPERYKARHKMKVKR